ncbi:MAG: AIR synthase family protein [Thermoproteota archaeon]
MGEKILGKIPPELLRKLVFSNLGAVSRRVMVGPRIGVDNAVIDLDGLKIVVSGDPITGARENIGRIGVDVSTNDVALAGAKPEFLVVVLIVPPHTEVSTIGRIMRQASAEAKRLGISIIGGHTEYSSIVKSPVFVGTAIGWTRQKKIISSSNAKPGDDIVIIGEAGIEGTYILASDLRKKLLEKGVPRNVLIRASRLVRNISVVRPALISADFASAMHDPTEGGVLGGIYEICDASGAGCFVDLSSIPVRKETRVICEALQIDPLKLISSGALLVTVNSTKTTLLLKRLGRRGFKAHVIGKITSRRHGRTGLLGSKVISIMEPPQDELWRLPS